MRRCERQHKGNPMPYPDNFSTTAFDRAMQCPPEVARRPLNAAELEIKRRVQSVLDAIAHLRAGPVIFDDNSLGDDAMQGVLVDGADYCRQIIAAVDDLPEEEAAAEECRIMEDW